MALPTSAASAGDTKAIHMNSANTRDAVVKVTETLLLGPFTSDEVLPSPPSNTYLTRILWPGGSEFDAAEDEGSGVERAADTTDESDQAVPGYRAIRPCSLGITFAVRRDTTLTVSLSDTARYTPRAVESASEAEHSNDRDTGES